MTEALDEILAWHARRSQRASAFTEDLRNWTRDHATTRALSSATSADGTLELTMFDVVGEDFWTGGGITAQKLKASLDANKGAKLIKVLLNSPGGDAFEGLAIQSLLRHSGARVEIEIMGLAASAATVIAMAGDSITIHEGAMFMVHPAWTIAAGSSSDFEAASEFLAKVDESAVGVYASRTGRPREEIAALVAATTWMTADEAVAEKFVNQVVPARAQPAASAAAPRSSMLQAIGLAHVPRNPSARWQGSDASASVSATKARGPLNAEERMLLSNFRHSCARATGLSGPSSRAELAAVVRTYLDGAAIVDEDAREVAERCRAELTQLGINLAPLDA